GLIGNVKDALSNDMHNRPLPKRATANIAMTKSAVPKLIVQEWNDYDAAIKNLWVFVNGWLYGGQVVKDKNGQKTKTVGLAEIIKQEVDSLAPYVNMNGVIQYDTDQQE